MSNPADAQPKVLVVEDQEDIRSLIVMTLEFGNYVIRQTDNGDEGWRLAQAWRPDVVLLDVMLPGGIDGFDVCARIKADPILARRVKVVMLTARGQAHDQDQGRKAGCDAYVVKPFSPVELIDLVDSLLEQQA